ncbi:MAG: hypothetical protein NVSMB27_13490 [Ktedonobacteraceae bacterium]
MNENSPNPNLNATELLELALRLATYPDDSRTQNAQLLPGQLPDQLPVDIPVPEGSHVLGSLIRNSESINILLDTHFSPAQVLTFYRQHMQATGWQTTEIHRPNRGGFMPSGSRSRGGNETFYQGLHDPALAINASGSSSAWSDDSNRNRSGPVLSVNAFTGKGNVTDVRLNLEMNGPFPPGPSPHMRGRPSRHSLGLLPALEAPEGANQIGHGGGGSLHSAHSDATLETNADLSTLTAHYKTQLEQAGCVISEEGQNGPLAWNTWTLKEDDEQWHGFFIILKVVDQEYYLNMRMKSANGSRATTER